MQGGGVTHIYTHYRTVLELYKHTYTHSVCEWSSVDPTKVPVPGVTLSFGYVGCARGTARDKHMGPSCLSFSTSCASMMVLT